MAVKSEQIEKNLIKLTFEVSPEKFEEGIKKTYAKNKNKFNVPGFRKGKVPRSVIEKYYTKAVFYDDAINLVLPEAYEAALAETGIEPVARPELDVNDIKEGESVVFTALITTKPEVTLGDYKGIEIEKIEHTVSDEDIDEELKKAQTKNARMISVEDRAVENGDITVIDFEGFKDDVAFEGGKGENHELEIGSGSFIPGFEEQLIGMNIGEERDITVTFPEEYHSDELAGAEARFNVKLHEIKVRELPELDDDFASEASEFETLDEFKNSIKENLEKQAEERTKRETEDAILAKIVENATVDIPDVMVENQIDNLVRDFAQRLSYQGMNLELYLQYSGMDMDMFRTQFTEQAEKQVRTSLVLEAISKAENVEVGEEEFELHLIDMAKQYNMEIEKLKELIPPAELDSMKSDFAITKTIQLVVNNAILK